MAFTYDPATSLGRVRLLISDRDEEGALFEDADLEAFLSIEDGDVKLAAADALEAIAANETLVLKRITALDLTTDGPAVAKALLDIAQRWRSAAEDAPAWDIAEQAHDGPTELELLYKQAQRGVI